MPHAAIRKQIKAAERITIVTIITNHTIEYCSSRSGYICRQELDAVTDTSSETIVQHTKAHFARYGISEKVMMYNGTHLLAKV